MRNTARPQTQPVSHDDAVRRKGRRAYAPELVAAATKLSAFPISGSDTAATTNSWPPLSWGRTGSSPFSTGAGSLGRQVPAAGKRREDAHRPRGQSGIPGGGPSRERAQGLVDSLHWPRGRSVPAECGMDSPSKDVRKRRCVIGNAVGWWTGKRKKSWAASNRY